MKSIEGNNYKDNILQIYRETKLLTRYGTDNILIMLGVAVLLFLGGYFVENKPISLILYILGIILTLFTFIFFRDPDRTIPEKVVNDSSYLVSPADGKVTEVVEEFEKHYIKKDCKRISIFLSPIDVHVNRSPVAGEVEFYEYIPGDFMAAYKPKASELNEHSRIGVKNEHGQVFFKQIVGIAARRIVCELKVGDKVNAGDKIGMMKFGSRMDISLEKDGEILVKPGDRVVAGETIIAKIKTVQ